MCLLPKFFNNMCFVFHAEAFDYVMAFEYLKSLRFDYLKNEKSFRSETSENVADTTFNVHKYLIKRSNIK